MKNGRGHRRRKKKKKDRKKAGNSSQTLSEYFDHLGKDNMKMLHKLAKQMMTEEGQTQLILRKVNVNFARTCYIKSYEVPNLRNVEEVNGEAKVYIKNEMTELVQRVVASHNYYGQGKSQFDDVMVAASEPNKEDGRMEVWFAKIISLLTLDTSKNIIPGTAKCTIHRKDNCSACTPTMMKELALVQYYDIVSSKEVPIDGAEKKLDCIRLKWTKANELEADKDSGKVYSLIPVDSIIARVHIASNREMLKVMKDDAPYKKAIRENIGPQDRWEGELFHVNKFYWD